MKQLQSLIFFTFITFFAYNQTSDVLTPEERAYLFHIVKKSPILDTNIGRYFEYSGPVIQFMNKQLNYDSIETIIINQPDKLFIRTSEIAKSQKGILAEAANKMALWELNKLLLAARGSEEDFEKFKHQFDQFEAIVLSKLPEKAKQQTGERVRIHKKLLAALNPSLNFDDKAAMLSSMSFLSDDDQLNVITALNESINTYVKQRTLAIFSALGGQASYFENILIAAGDGSETSGLLNEREKDENGRWNKGLPKAVGLFPYQVRLKEKQKRKQSVLEPQTMPLIDLQTVGENKQTQIHFDVWGYNSKKQTTVVIERNGISYHLFGSNDTRFLSPDSSFNEGKTFQAVINELKTTKIKPIEERIYGKKGYDFQIAEAQRKKDETKIKIDKTEKEYTELSNQPITTSSKASRKVNKARKAAAKKPGSTYNGNPTAKANKSAKGKKQAELVNLYGRYEYFTKKIKELTLEKENALVILAGYQQKLEQYSQAMGLHWMDYTEKNGLYTFSDSTTFDLYTQDFTFKADSLKSPFTIRLIAIPNAPLSEDVDEVMLHINVIDAKKGYDARFQFEQNDLFASNDWKLNEQLIQLSDSVAIQQFFEALLDKKMPFKTIVRGNGVGSWNGYKTVRTNVKKEWDSYLIPVMDSSMVRLRTTQISLFINRGLFLEINTFTDPVKTNIVKPEDHKNLLADYQLSDNDYLSALRAASVIQKLKSELNMLAGSYLSREEAKIVIDRLNKTLDATRISCGPISFKWQELVH
jgi:hypothetical protein